MKAMRSIPALGLVGTKGIGTFSGFLAILCRHKSVRCQELWIIRGYLTASAASRSLILEVITSTQSQKKHI
jgi:hypothetical protein